VLGADTFAGRRLEFDFTGGRLNAGPAPAALPATFTAVAAETVHRTFFIIPATVGGVAVRALVDSGARATLANRKLMQAMGYAEDDARLKAESGPAGATGHVMRTWTGAAADLTVGGERLAGQKLVFAELPVFAPLGLDEGPSLLLGIDSLRRFGAVALDYTRAEVQFRPRR
jgi:hypothetical protein